MLSRISDLLLRIFNFHEEVFRSIFHPVISLAKFLILGTTDGNPLFLFVIPKNELVSCLTKAKRIYTINLT